MSAAIIVNNTKPDIDWTPLSGEKLEKLYDSIKLSEGTSHWTGPTETS